MPAPTRLRGQALATLFGVARSTVTTWKSEGCPSQPDTKDGAPTYLPSEVVQWLTDRAKESAAPLDKDAEQVRKLKAEADRVELEVAKVRGELVPLSEFERVLAADHDETRAALTALPSKFARLVVDRTGCTMGVAQTLLADIADATLTEMQGEGEDDGS
jgi:terminase small subunit / prophage DNA-packing protein